MANPDSTEREDCKFNRSVGLRFVILEPLSTATDRKDRAVCSVVGTAYNLKISVFSQQTLGNGRIFSLYLRESHRNPPV